MARFHAMANWWLDPTGLLLMVNPAGGVIEWPVPAGQSFNMTSFITGIRGAGCFLTEDIYIPHDEIACIGYGAAALKVTPPGTGRMQ